MDEKTEAQGSETTVSKSQQWETVRRGFPAMSVWLTDLALAVTVSRWAIPKPSSGLQHLPSCLGSSVQFSHSVVSDSLWPHGLQHERLPYPSPTPRACSNSCPSRRWCHPTISSSVIPFSSCLQCFLASAFFPMSQFFASGDQIIGVSASASVLPMNIQDWFPLGLIDLISLQSKRFSRVFSNTTVQKHQNERKWKANGLGRKKWNCLFADGMIDYGENLTELAKNLISYYSKFLGYKVNITKVNSVPIY